MSEINDIRRAFGSVDGRAATEPTGPVRLASVPSEVDRAVAAAFGRTVDDDPAIAEALRAEHDWKQKIAEAYGANGAQYAQSVAEGAWRDVVRAGGTFDEYAERLAAVHRRVASDRRTTDAIAEAQRLLAHKPAPPAPGAEQRKVRIIREARS